VNKNRSTIARFVTGDYLAPAGHRFGGQRIVAVAYLIRHPEATILFDTGFPFAVPTPSTRATTGSKPFRGLSWRAWTLSAHP